MVNGLPAFHSFSVLRLHYGVLLAELGDLSMEPNRVLTRDSPPYHRPYLGMFAAFESPRRKQPGTMRSSNSSFSSGSMERYGWDTEEIAKASNHIGASFPFQGTC